MKYVYGFVCLILTLLCGCTRTEPPEDLKPLLNKYVHAWNTGDVNELKKVVSGDFALRMSPQFEAVRSSDSLANTIRLTRTAYPDFTITPDEVVYTANAIAVRWTVTATNSGPGMTRPTGKHVVVPGMSIFHVVDGKIIDEWVSANDLYWAVQLGYQLVPVRAAK